jgi:hypothetical protein
VRELRAAGAVPHCPYARRSGLEALVDFDVTMRIERNARRTSKPTRICPRTRGSGGGKGCKSSGKAVEGLTVGEWWEWSE